MAGVIHYEITKILNLRIVGLRQNFLQQFVILRAGLLVSNYLEIVKTINTVQDLDALNREKFSLYSGSIGRLV